MTKAAILIDGGFFLKRLPTVRPDVNARDADAVVRAVWQLVDSHLKQLNRLAQYQEPHNLLYRCFFYDGRPYQKKEHLPVSGRAIDYAKTPDARFREALFDGLRRRRNFAVRLGETIRERGWVMNEDAQKALLKGNQTVADLTDNDFQPGIRQKAVDMRIGVDVSSLTLKRQVDTIILVAGDADFVPAAKLARREGVRIVLDPLWKDVSPDLYEHIDGLRSGFANPSRPSGPAHADTDDSSDESTRTS